MKKIFLIAALAFTAVLNAQTSRTLKKILELIIPREGGANGASVAWHPGLKKYYAAMSGNTDFFIGVYDFTGKRLNPITQKVMFDVRGLWYNPAAKALQMNGYNDFGWGEYKLDAKGFPIEVTVLNEGMNQPDEQSVGAFNAKEKIIYFFNGEGNIEKYDLASGEHAGDIELTLGKTKDDDFDDGDNYDVLQDYNNTTIVYTGITNAEIGLLNAVNKEIELYNLKDGHLTRKLALPEDAPAEDFLNFAYCNSVYWLFDNKARIWKGYK